MKNTSLFRRILSVALVIALLGSFLVPTASAAETDKKVTSGTKELTLEPIDPGTLESQKQGVIPAEASKEEPDHRASDVVRVSIVLEKASTLDAGFRTENIAKNAAAVAYRESLRNDQKEMTAKIEKVIGGKLDVKWNLTLAANNISANVRYDQIDAIKAIDGVKDVFLENRYEPQVDNSEDEPNNGSASYMIGSNITWANGYTGAGSKVAVIDTGADIEHQSFSGEGLEYALAQNAEEKGLPYEDYIATLNLLTAEEIEAVKDQLNANIGSGEAAYRNTKVGYGYNYVDKDVSYITHIDDTQGEHGSHVSGISTANRFINVDGEFVPALQAVGTQGVAPDAQLVVMKVFGKGGGAYDSDYMVAIEDAIVLGCDSANLSLGSGSAGFSFSKGYEDIMNKLVENGTVVAFSAGNSYGWYDTVYNSAMLPYLYVDDINYATNGSPGSFTNALTVASVDNVGQTGMPLLFGDRHVFYSQTEGYGNEPISTIAGSEYQYVLVDGPGVDDNDHVGGEGDQFAALGSEVLTGKVAMCYRGSSSFFAKANAAVAQGAVAVIIINNTTGVINMNLSGYEYTAPAVSILKADGDAIKAASEPVTDEAGNVLYYTGSMSISDEMEVSVPDEITDTVTVSSFSSWGGPGSMVLKPEILAPGGSIYSVNGLNNAGGGHDQYEVMSGTSMASPQVAGMAAVMGQYIRDNDLCNKTGKSARQLINSLLMSTAHPVYDSNGAYWPVIRVGAGLGNVADATAAKSFIMMDEGSTMFPDSAKDGKVKAELGDDPDYTGEYEFSFMVYPLEDAKEFTLRTDIFTQWQPANGGYAMVQTQGTVLLGSTATYEVNGETYEDTYLLEADVNMDGKTDAADAQAILDHITGELAEDADFDETVADVDQDGDITTYDAKLLLDNAATPIVSITEPTKVTVHVKIDEGDKAFLLRYFSKGFYVEGYTYVDPVADEEGVLDVVHSIPIYGFCGSWTDPAMLDRTSVIDEIYGTGLLPYLANTQINYMSVKTPDGTEQIFVGNPYKPELEEAFPVDRLAINSQATITGFTYQNIRNTATLAATVQDAEGNFTFAQATAVQRFASYYYVNGGYWNVYTPGTFNVGKMPAGMGYQEGDELTVNFYALPEYYGVVNARNNGEVATTGGLDTEGFLAVLDSGIVGSGAGFGYTMKVDDTAPEVKGALMDLITGDVYVKASDNNYIAYVGVLNKAGTVEYLGVIPEQSEPGEEIEVPLVFEEGVKLPNQVVLLVGDYAGNETAFKINLSNNDGPEEDPMAGVMMGFVTDETTIGPGSGNRMWQIDPEKLQYALNTSTYNLYNPKGLSVYANTDFSVVAAEYLEGYVFMAADDGWIYAAKLDGMDEISRVGRYDDVTGTIYDLAFNYANKRLYALGENNTLYRVNVITGELKEAAILTLPGSSYEANRLAIDDNGVFYTADSAGPSSATLYKFTLDGEALEPEQPIEGEVAYSWDFEDGTEGWTFVDSDEDGYNWTWNQDAASWWEDAIDLNSLAHNSTGCLLTASFINTAGVLTPDNWAISPAIDLSEVEDAFLSFYLASLQAIYPEKVSVYAGTSPNPGEMNMIQDSITTPDSWTAYTLSLADYVGEDEVYVAFRNFGTTDMYIGKLDDVSIIIPETVEPETVETVTRSGNVIAVPVGATDPDPEAPSHVAYTNSFEDDSDLEGWTVVDADGDGNNWSIRTQGDGDNTWDILDGDRMLFSASYAGVALTPDNWVISAPLDLSELEDAKLSVWVQAQDASYPSEKFALYAGTSSEPEDMTMIGGPFILTPTRVAGNWIQYLGDLDEFVGEDEVYVAVRHYDCTDMFYINIDVLQILTNTDIPEPEPEPEPEEPVLAIEATPVGSGMGVYNYSYGGSMAWDHDKDILYLASNYTYSEDYDHYLWIVDTETGEAARANTVGGTALDDSNPSARLGGAVRGLFIVPDNNPVIVPADEATGLEVVPSELNLLKGQSAQLDAAVFPWTLRDKDVTWTSADESIATVKDGLVTGVGEGETVITVTTVAEPVFTVDVPVTVTLPPEATLRGVIWDENGKGQASVFNTNEPEAWEALAEVGQLRWGARSGDRYYGSTADTLFVIDADTLEILNQVSMGQYAQYLTPSDADYINPDWVAEWGYNGTVIGPGYNGSYLWIVDHDDPDQTIGFNLSSYFSDDPMALFAYMGETATDAYYMMITESGAMWQFTITSGGNLSANQVGSVDLNLKGVSDVTNNIWGSMVYDPETEFLFVTLYNGGDDYAHLYAIDANDPSRMVETGNFRESVWPVAGLYQYDPLTDLTMFVEDESLTLFETQSKALNVRIKLGETNEYTVEIADETIASYADGYVTGVKEGETTLTITTVDVNDAGEHLSVELPVTVKPLKSIEGFVAAQVTDGNGARFTKISLDGAVVSRKGFEAPGSIVSGGRGGDIYVADLDGALNILDAETYEPTDAWNAFDASAYAEMPAMDFANYPVFLMSNGKADESKFVYTGEPGYLVCPDGSYWDLSSYIPKIAAIAFAGTTTMNDGTNDLLCYVYYILDTDGILYQMAIDIVGARRTTPQAVLDTGIVLGDQGDASMTMLVTAKVNGDESVDYDQAGLVIADNGTKNLWFIDFMTEDPDDVVGMIGAMDVENVSGLAGTYDELISVADMQDIEPWTPPEGLIAGWYFEDAAEMNGWTMLDNDGDGNFFERYTSSYTSAYEGSYVLCSRWNASASVDDWAITPAIDLSEVEAAELSFYVSRGSYDENYAVYAGTTNNPEEMVEILPETAPSTAWENVIVDLSQFAGEDEVYIGFRHFDGVDKYRLYIDQVEVFEVKGDEPADPFEPVFWGFESEDETSDWTFHDEDADGSTFHYTSGYNGYEGNGYLVASWGHPIPDDWAITPAISLNGAVAPELSFFCRDSGNSEEHVAVYVGEEANPDTMTQVADFIAPDSYEETIVDLTAYVGKTIYVALRHYETNDGWNLFVDNVSVREHAEADPGFFAAVPFKAAPTLPEGMVRFAELVDDQTQLIKVGETANAVNGGLNAVKGTVLPIETRALTDETVAAEGQVAIDLTEDKAITNALYFVEYDADVLSFVSADSLLPYKSINHVVNEVTEDGETAKVGVITLAIASAEEIPAETVLASLLFSYEGDEIDTEITVYTAERDNDVAIEGESLVIPVKVEKPVCEHEYGEPVWSWTEDLSAATATFTCASCGDEQILDAEITVEYLEDKTVYTATVVFNEETYTDVKEGPAAEIFELIDVVKDGDKVVIYNPMAGMAVSNADFSEAQPSYRAGLPVEPKDQKVYNPETELVWTVQVVEGGVQFLDAEGHKLSMENKGLELDKTNDVWEIRSLNEEDFTVAIVNVNAAAGSSGDPKALEWYSKYSEFSTHYLNTEDGQFIFELYAQPAPEVPHEHVYGEPVWTWNEDLTAATATFTCDCGDQQVLDAAITEIVVTEAVPHIAGEKKIIATVTFNDDEYTDEKTVEIEALPCPCAHFTDMPEYGTPEHEAIDWAYTNKYASGMNSTSFGVGKTLTRAQTATFLYAAAGKPEFDVDNAPKTFSDVPAGKWYTKPVLWAAAEGIVAGYSDGTFKPNGTLTRGQILVILYAQAGKPEITIENPYTDVPDGKWYTKAALWAYEAGIERGADGKFEQKTPCTRDTFVLYLYRFMTGNLLLGEE